MKNLFHSALVGISLSFTLLTTPAVLADGDHEKGRKIFNRCRACHTVEEGDRNKIGPNLYGIVSRDVASKADFNYSDAFLAVEGSWSKERLDEYLTAPRTYVKGTRMAFPGLKKAEDRQNIIAYLATFGGK